MTDFNITQVKPGEEPRNVGAISWTPEDWDYTTTDGEVERFLSAVKADGIVVGQTSEYGENGDIYSYIDTEFKASDPDFVGQLSDTMVRLTFHPEAPSTWIEPKSVNRG